jgi:hypothetical protein
MLTIFCTALLQKVDTKVGLWSRVCTCVRERIFPSLPPELKSEKIKRRAAAGQAHEKDSD